VVANMFSVPLGIMFGADISVAYYIRNSLIASFLCNVVGVAGLAVYFYLWDYDVGGLRDAETGDIRRRDESSENMEAK
ncbi:hypothetical protein GGX14DRAFT_356998, partial [Mycena pura]